MCLCFTLMPAINLVLLNCYILLFQCLPTSFLIDTADFMVKYAICNIRYAITSLYKTDDMTHHTRIWVDS